MYQAAEEIQVEPDFAIYQNSHSGNEDSQLEYLEESDGIQLCNQPWVDYDENAYDVNEESCEAEDQNEFIALEALKVPGENESCDDGGVESSSQSQELEQRKRKLSNVIVLDSDDDNSDEDEDVDQNVENPAKKERYTENNESDDDVILIEDDENDSGFLRNDSSFLAGNNRSISFGYYNDLNPVARTENGAYECNLCGKRVASSYNLKRHMMIHTGERPFGCDICDKRFREFSDLKKHRRVHSSDPAYKCMVCMINTPSPMNPTKCYSCDQIRVQGPPPSSLVKKNLGTIIQSPSLINSTATINNIPASIVHRTVPSTVNPTLRNFATKSTSNSNLIRNFSPASPAPMASSFTNEIVAEHFQYTEDGINKRGYSCPICDRIFGSRHNLKRHFMIHTGEKPYSCDVCDRSFREFSTLKKHSLTHMRGKFYNCEICGEEFNNYGSYTAHTLKHSNNSNNFNYDDVDPLGNTSGLISPNAIMDRDTNALYKNNMFQCIACDKSFKEQEKLNAHLVVHKNDVNKFSEDLTKIDDDVPIIVNNPIDC